MEIFFPITWFFWFFRNGKLVLKVKIKTSFNKIDEFIMFLLFFLHGLLSGNVFWSGSQLFAVSMCTLRFGLMPTYGNFFSYHLVLLDL